MAYGALYYMSFPRTMDPSLRWDDELCYVANGPNADTNADYSIGPLVYVINMLRQVQDER
jgi:hypothetical protein